MYTKALFDIGSNFGATIDFPPNCYHGKISVYFNNASQALIPKIIVVEFES